MGPCIGESLSFDFTYADLAYSNLGGAGPDTWAPAAIRYVNVGKVVLSEELTIRFDLEVTARSSYVPYNSSLNAINGRFAQINLASNQAVDLRTTVKRSCSTMDSCKVCSDKSTFPERVSCFSAGCSCFGEEVYSLFDCDAASKEASRLAYNCSSASTTLILPSSV